MKYEKYLTDDNTEKIEYYEYISDNLNNSINYSEYIAFNLDKSINYTEYISEVLSETKDQKVRKLRIKKIKEIFSNEM